MSALSNVLMIPRQKALHVNGVIDVFVNSTNMHTPLMLSTTEVLRRSQLPANPVLVQQRFLAIPLILMLLGHRIASH